jgi:hypothetical protein
MAVPAITAKTVVAEIVDAWAEISIALLDLRDNGPSAFATILFADEKRDAAVKLIDDPAVNTADEVPTKDREADDMVAVSVDDAEMDLAELRAILPELLRASKLEAETCIF